MEERISTRKRRENEAVENGAENVIAFSILEITAIDEFAKLQNASKLKGAIVHHAGAPQGVTVTWGSHCLE